MNAWLFVGQDAFTAELGLSLLDDPLGTRLLAQVETLTGVEVCTPASRRRAATWDTALLQPLLAAVAMTLAARHTPPPDVVAGASLGALLAWAVATDQDPERVVEVAAVRGRAMAACARAHPGGMIVVEDRHLDEALRRGRAKGVLDPAARNVPGQWILSGDNAALRAVGALARPVPVTGPWHSARMAAAEPEVRAALATLPDRPPRWPVIFDGAPLGDAGVLAVLTTPVHWHATLERLRGVDRMWVLGPARVLRAQVRAVLGVEALEVT